ncbi:hypothetical protein MPSEU_000211400 [Mayamaea pseudoterrestris]|nr:hypothetical protein MPSEU_000211400 [Mayamaea pseudoterrestris]
MAGSRRRLQNHRANHQQQSAWSIRSLATTTSGFVAAIALLVMFRLFGGSSLSPRSALFNSPQEIPLDILFSIDAVLVLGGGVPENIDNPPIYVQQRCDDAAQVVQRYNLLSTRRKNRKMGLPILCLSAGTAHLPQLLGHDGLPVWEATSSAAYLIKKHNITNVFVETTSYDTIGNAYYARTAHTDHNSWRHLLIVTSKFHMERTRAIFDWIFGLDNKKGYVLHYLESPDVGLSPEALYARSMRETNSLKSVKQLADSHQSIGSVWKFLHTEHSLYTASKLVERGNLATKSAPTSDLLRKSYGAW